MPKLYCLPTSAKAKEVRKVIVVAIFLMCFVMLNVSSAQKTITPQKAKKLSIEKRISKLEISINAIMEKLISIESKIDKLSSGVGKTENNSNNQNKATVKNKSGNKTQCKGLTKKGTQCSRMTNDPSGFCYQHRK